MARRPVGLENLFGPPKQKSKSEELAMKRAANKSWHKPPQITPNYGNTKKNIQPRSNLSRVLLHDNTSQQMLLDAKLDHLKFEREKSSHLFDLHKKTFLVQQSLKQHHLLETGITHLSLLPNHVANGYCQLYGNSLGLKMDVLDKSGEEKKRQKLEKAKERVLFVTKYRPDSTCSLSRDQQLKRETSAGTFASRARTPAIEEETTEGDKNSSSGSKPGSALFPKLGSGKPKVGVMRGSHSAVPGENRPSSRAFLTHDYQLRRGHTFTNPRYSAKRHARSNEPKSDPRFILLHRSLIPNDRDLGGFLSLSPSGAGVLEKYGRPLLSASTE